MTCNSINNYKATHSSRSYAGRVRAFNMHGLYVLLAFSYCKLVLCESHPEAYNNYTYRVFHWYNYTFVQPSQQATNGEFQFNSNGNFPADLPKPILDEFNRRNIPLPPTPSSNNNNKPEQQIWNEFQYPPDISNQLRKSRQDNENAGNNSLTIMTVNGTDCAYGFCEQADNYPEQLVLRLVEENGLLSNFFKPKPPDIGIRLNAGFENVCDVTKKTFTPKTAENVEGKNRVVVNLKNYKQIVESEICKEGGTCKFQNYWPEGYVGTCIQKYVEVPLAVMDENNNQVIVEKFSYPSGCYCACKSD